MLTFFSQFSQRVSDVTTELATQGIPLTAPVTPAPPPGPDDRGPAAVPPAGRPHHPRLVHLGPDAEHPPPHPPLSTQVPSADALIGELGVRGLAQLHTYLHDSAPIDYRFTRCPYCSGCGEDPLLPVCTELGCPRSTSSSATATSARSAWAPNTSPSGSARNASSSSTACSPMHVIVEPGRSRGSGRRPTASCGGEKTPVRRRIPKGPYLPLSGRYGPFGVSGTRSRRTPSAYADQLPRAGGLCWVVKERCSLFRRAATSPGPARSVRR